MGPNPPVLSNASPGLAEHLLLTLDFPSLSFRPCPNTVPSGPTTLRWACAIDQILRVPTLTGKIHVEAPTPNMTVFAHRASKETVKVKRDQRGALIS